MDASGGRGGERETTAAADAGNGGPGEEKRAGAVYGPEGGAAGILCAEGGTAGVDGAEGSAAGVLGAEGRTAGDLGAERRTTSETKRCVACGAPAPGRFCAACGAEQAEAVAPSLKHFLREGVREVTELDSTLLSSFRALVTRPGELTRAYMRGERGRYIRPLKAFFIANVLYFFAAGLTQMNTFATPLAIQETSPPVPALKATLVARTLRREHTNEDGLAPRWNALTEAHARTLIVLMVPLYALVFAGLLVWTRRPAVQHLVFATHFMTFYILFLTALAVVLGPVPARVWQSLAGASADRDLGIVGLAVLSVYTYMAVRRAYDVGRGSSLAVTVGAAVLAYPVLVLYRFVLFFTVYWAIT